MDLLTLAFYYIYLAVALFYIVSGAVLLIYPKAIANKIAGWFPLLHSFKYQNITASLNLIMVGLILLVIVRLLENWSFMGMFWAVVLSGLEVYLGIRFYYQEQRDLFQAWLHIILHLIIVIGLAYFILTHFSSDITTMEDQLASLAKATLPWTSK
tara:strand:+ start:8197 stop:8661 length:465 start_codon:yes stop_codon:yes gene_type:complete